MAAGEPEHFSTDVNLDHEGIISTLTNFDKTTPLDLKDLQKEEEEGTRGAPKLIISNASEKTICIKIAEIATIRQDVPILGKRNLV
jgi:hypothetical protein